VESTASVATWRLALVLLLDVGIIVTAASVLEARIFILCC
jgi:hypothetical protein